MTCLLRHPRLVAAVAVVLVAGSTSSAAGAEPNWSERYEQLKAEEIGKFVAPKYGGTIRIILTIGGEREGILSDITRDAVTLVISGKRISFPRSKLTKESRVRLFAEDYAASIAVGRAREERKEYLRRQADRNRQAELEARRRKEHGEYKFTTDFRELRAAAERMTDSDFQWHAKALVGETVNWRGWPEEIKREFFGGYQCLVDMDGPVSSDPYREVKLDIAEGDVSRVPIGKRQAFSGVVKTIRKKSGSVRVILTDGRFP